MRTINGIQYADMIRSGAENLNEHRTVVNELNVFPIPDGDTGDNMFMTISSGCDAVPDGTGDLEAVSSAAAYGMLLGARGNSGVILSRIFSGIAKSLAGCSEADVRKFGDALSCGISESYGAVPVPVEGTILTVFKDAVHYANGRIADGHTFERYFDDFTDALKISLEKTPDLLDVLKQAGVVDSGGAGLVYIAEGMKDALNGCSGVSGSSERGSAPAKKGPDLGKFGPDSVLTFGYCTEFLLRLQNAKTDLDHFDLDALIAYLNGVGDSLVCFREGSVVKVHVHTKIPGDVLNHCQQYGEFLTVKMENMNIQHEETTIRNNYFTPGSQRENSGPHKKFGFVAVAAGEGLKEFFRSLGADYVVDGGQSMNPSAEEFLSAFDAVNADVIYVFPNNGNIVLTARQAASLYDGKDIRVIPSHSIGQGYCALSMLDDSSGDPDAIESDLNDAIGGVVTGAVSVATRDTEQNGLAVKRGQYIGFVGDEIHSVASSPEDAVLGLAGQLHAEKYDVLLLLKGSDASEDDAEALAGRLESMFRRTETVLQPGGQPVYQYIMILQ